MSWATNLCISAEGWVGQNWLSLNLNVFCHCKNSNMHVGCQHMSACTYHVIVRVRVIVIVQSLGFWYKTLCNDCLQFHFQLAKETTKKQANQQPTMFPINQSCLSLRYSQGHHTQLNLKLCQREAQNLQCPRAALFEVQSQWFMQHGQHEQTWRLVEVACCVQNEIDRGASRQFWFWWWWWPIVVRCPWAWAINWQGRISVKPCSLAFQLNHLAFVGLTVVSQTADCIHLQSYSPISQFS